MTARQYKVTTHHPEISYRILAKDKPEEIKTYPAYDNTMVLNGRELSEIIEHWSGHSSDAPTWTVETLAEPQMEQEWYVKKRERVEAHVKEVGLGDEVDSELSPSGRWHLSLRGTNPTKSWDYTQATIERVADESYQMTVIRNYPNFHHGWVEDYQGHDYLLCGEDYQGVTVIELDTLKEVHYIHPSAEQGNGFCFAEYTLLPDNKMQVLGCFWAAPYEKVIYDFSNPLDLPWPELYRESAFETDEEDIAQELRNG